MYFVGERAISLIRQGANGEEVVLHDTWPGEFIAEASLCSSRYQRDAVATEPSVLLRMPRQAID